LDNLTHTLTGLMLARAGLGKSVPRAGLLLMVAANAPDCDVVSWIGGSTVYLHYHRWFTHAFAALPLMALFAVLIARVFARGKPFPWLKATGIAAIGALSHLLLDFTNIYGIRLLLPFGADWLRLDIVNIVDLWIWGIFAVAIAAPALAKLVSSEIGAKSDSRRAWAIFALLLIGGYEWARYVAHDRALALLNARVYNGEAPTRVAAFPNAWNLLRWRGLVETPGAYRFFDVNVATEFDPTATAPIYKAEPNAAIAAASRDPVFQEFLSFSAYPLWRTLPVNAPPGATEVHLMDLRFGTPQQPGFIARGIVETSGGVGQSEFGFGRLRPR
jgi:inner membrane protein